MALRIPALKKAARKMAAINGYTTKTAERAIATSNVNSAAPVKQVLRQLRSLNVLKKN